MLITWYEREIAKYPYITVEMNTEITDISTLKADEIIVATGAKAKSIPVKGSEKAIQAVDFLLGKKKLAKKLLSSAVGLPDAKLLMNFTFRVKNLLS